MTILTLIPEAGTYGIAVLAVAGVSTFSLGYQLHARWLAARWANPMWAHVAVGALVAGWGALVIDPVELVDAAPWANLAAVPAGLGVGWVATRADRAVLRRAVRRRRASRPAGGGALRRGEGAARLSAPIAITGGLAPRRDLGMAKMQRTPAPGWSAAASRPALLAAAVVEELIYRGFLVEAALLAPTGWASGLLLAGTVVAFGLAHIWFGWAHVVAKLPLGALTLGLVLVTGTVVGAVAAHVVFNLAVWRDQAALPARRGAPAGG